MGYKVYLVFHMQTETNDWLSVYLWLAENFNQIGHRHRQHVISLLQYHLLFHNDVTTWKGL